MMENLYIGVKAKCTYSLSINYLGDILKSKVLVVYIINKMRRTGS